MVVPELLFGRGVLLLPVLLVFVPALAEGDGVGVALKIGVQKRPGTAAEAEGERWAEPG